MRIKRKEWSQLTILGEQGNQDGTVTTPESWDITSQTWVSAIWKYQIDYISLKLGINSFLEKNFANCMSRKTYGIKLYVNSKWNAKQM